MQVAVDEEKLRLMYEALQQADDLVTMVIKCDGGASRSALLVARTLNDLKRKHGLTPPIKASGGGGPYSPVK